VDDQELVTEAQLERWVGDFDSWDLCDGVCALFERTPFASAKAVEWAGREEEFVRRAAFTLMAYFAVHDKLAVDERYLALLPVIRAHAGDDRNFVKKAVNWALRSIGKRNLVLNAAAVATAEQIRADGSRSGRWIAADALRELRGEAVQARLRR
ncbi:MAG: DNA alkylation repair protein, partial [Tepidiformaceae bacterium]